MNRKSIAAWDAKPGMATTDGVIESVVRRGDLVRITFVGGAFRNCSFTGRAYPA